jgi:hypothetical protein
MLIRQETVTTAVSRFAELSTLQWSVVILKDMLDESLIGIAALLDLTVDAVKGHLVRGRAPRTDKACGEPERYMVSTLCFSAIRDALAIGALRRESANRRR